MDRSLAKGHVRRYLDGIFPHETIRSWNTALKVPCIIRMFSEASRGSNPQPAVKRLSAMLSPAFPAPDVLAWNNRGGYDIVARRISCAPASQVLHPQDPGLALFDERAVFLSQVRLVRWPKQQRMALDRVGGFSGNLSGIGEHAIRRLLERGFVSPDDLPARVESILVQVGALREALYLSDLDGERPWTLLLPIPGGAAVAVTHQVATWPGMPVDRLSRIASVRTVLTEAMLTPGQQDRLSGCNDPLELRARDPEAFAAWLRRNARPWEPQLAEGDEPELGEDSWMASAFIPEPSPGEMRAT